MVWSVSDFPPVVESISSENRDNNLTESVCNQQNIVSVKILHAILHHSKHSIFSGSTVQLSFPFGPFLSWASSTVFGSVIKLKICPQIAWIRVYMREEDDLYR